MCLIWVRVPQEDLIIHNNHVFRYMTKYVVIFFIEKRRKTPGFSCGE